MGYLAGLVFGTAERVANRWRITRLRLAGAKIAPRVRIGRGVRSDGPVRIGDGTRILDGVILSGAIHIGRNCLVQKQAELYGNVETGDGSTIGSSTIITTSPTGRVQIGRDVLVNAFTVIGANECIEIGDHCIFAAFVQITDSTHGTERPEELTKHAPSPSAPVRIEQNVWLGSAVMVMMGVSIGHGSVVGAKSLINSDIPPMSIAYGVPARVERSRTTGTLELRQAE